MCNVVYFQLSIFYIYIISGTRRPMHFSWCHRRAVQPSECLGDSVIHSGEIFNGKIPTEGSNLVHQ